MKRSIPRKRVPAPPHTPAYRRSNHGLHAIALTHNLSYASLYRQHVTLGQPLQSAISHCRTNGLTYIPRGQPKLGLRRTIRPAKPTPPKP